MSPLQVTFCIKGLLHHVRGGAVRHTRLIGLKQCATFPIDRGPDLGKNWVGLGKLSNLVVRRSMVISCVLLDDSITGLQVYIVGLWWIILTLDRWSMTSADTISHTVEGKLTGAFTLSQSNGSQSHLAARTCAIRSYSTRWSMLSDNSPVGVLALLGFATRVNVLACQTRATVHKIATGVKTKVSSCEQISHRFTSHCAWCKRTLNWMQLSCS